jgi:hypothetical protein
MTTAADTAAAEKKWIECSVGGCVADALAGRLVEQSKNARLPVERNA